MGARKSDNNKEVVNFIATRRLQLLNLSSLRLLREVHFHVCVCVRIILFSQSVSR